MAYLNNLDAIAEIQRTGKYGGKAAMAFHITGRRAAFTSTSAFNDVGEGIGAAGVANFPVLTGAETIEVISSSASDDGAPPGTGAQMIKVTYIDTNWAIQQTGNITLNGLAAVTVMAGGMLLPLFFEVTAVGSNTTAVGTITLRTNAPVTLSQISPGGNKSLDAIFLVPEGYSAYVPYWSSGAVANKQDVRLRATVDSYTRAQGTVYHFQDNMFVGADANRQKELPWLKYSQYSFIKASTISSSTALTTRCDVEFWVVLIQD